MDSALEEETLRIVLSVVLLELDTEDKGCEDTGEEEGASDWVETLEDSTVDELGS